MATKFLDKTGLSHFWSKIKAWCNTVFAPIVHNQASNTINAMTGYSKPSSGGAIATSDSLNSAVGKLEAKVDAITIPTIPDLSRTISGSGNAITDITVSGHAITVTKGSTFLTSHQSLDGKMTRGSYERIQGTSSTHNDLNNYTTAGFYNVKTQYVDNCPSDIGIDAVLLVYPWNTGSFCTQELTESADSSNIRRWMRKLSTKGWGDWKQLAFQSSLANYVTLNSAQTISGVKTFTGEIIGINKNNVTDNANDLYSTTVGSKLTYYTTTNSTTKLVNVPAAVNMTLESRTIRSLSDSDWIVEQICHNSNGLYYRKGNSGTWGVWKTFAFTDSDITGNAATATALVDDSNYMHLTGNESISGIKTFTGQFQRSSNIVGTMFRHPEAVRGTVPSNNKEWIIPFCDASGVEWDSNGNHGRLGSISVMQFSDGQTATTKTSLASYANIAGSTLAAGLDVGFAGENGDVPWAQAPSTRADRTAGRDIVTRDWLDNDASNLVHRSGIEVIHDIKIFDAADFRLRNTAIVKGSNPPSGTVVNWSYHLGDSQGGMSASASDNGRMGTFSGVLTDDGTMSVSIVACKNEAGTVASQSIGVAYAQDGSYWGYAPSTSALRSSGTDIVTRDWIPQDSRIVHTTNDETIAGAKIFTSSNGLSILRTLDRNQTVSSLVVLNGIQINGKNSLNTHRLSLLAFERNSASSVLGLSEYANRSFLRVAGATGKVADLSVNMTDTNHAAVSVSVSDGVLFDGYIGQNKVFITEGGVADSSLGIMQDGVHQYRCGTLRFGNYSDYNLAALGSCDKNNKAPRGISIYTYTSGATIAKSNCDFQPETHNNFNLGASNNRWANLYINASAVSTSDKRCKSLISDIPNEVLDAWEEISYVQFKFKDAIEEKGINKARLHNGLIAQDIDKVFKDKNLDASLYGLFCYDEWDSQPETRAKDGELIGAGIEAGNLYSMRYTEVACMEAAYQRRKNKILENRISELETQVQNMLQILESLKGA